MVDQVRRAASLTSQLTDEAFRVLSASASLLPRFMSIPLSSLIKYTSLPEDRVRYAERVLVKEGLWVKEGLGYRMTMLGLDTLALHALVKKGLLSHVGIPIGIGKESDVYEAIDAEGNPVALKLFRIGRISFRSLAKKRAYNSSQGHRWLLSSIESAEREEKMLERLDRFKLNVPRCRGRAYHSIVMEMKLGLPLYKVKRLADAGEVLMKILNSVRQLYLKAKIVNSDLSEFNVLITPEHEIVLIDWPQAASVKDPASDAALHRDIRNIVTYFRKKFDVVCDLDQAVSFCKGEVRKVDVRPLPLSVAD
ncbi:MAG: RIO1 family regulatory kinase/ATPase [Conexivisphaerales archaeon]